MTPDIAAKIVNICEKEGPAWSFLFIYKQFAIGTGSASKIIFARIWARGTVFAIRRRRSRLILLI